MKKTLSKQEKAEKFDKMIDIEEEDDDKDSNFKAELR